MNTISNQKVVPYSHICCKIQEEYPQASPQTWFCLRFDNISSPSLCAYLRSKLGQNAAISSSWRILLESTKIIPELYLWWVEICIPHHCTCAMNMRWNYSLVALIECQNHSWWNNELHQTTKPRNNTYESISNSGRRSSIIAQPMKHKRKSSKHRSLLYHCNEGLARVLITGKFGIEHRRLLWPGQSEAKWGDKGPKGSSWTLVKKSLTNPMYLYET